jgi:hypothetical protein
MLSTGQEAGARGANSHEGGRGMPIGEHTVFSARLL